MKLSNITSSIRSKLSNKSRGAERTNVVSIKHHQRRRRMVIAGAALAGAAVTAIVLA